MISEKKLPSEFLLDVVGFGESGWWLAIFYLLGLAHLPSICSTP